MDRRESPRRSIAGSMSKMFPLLPWPKNVRSDGIVVLVNTIDRAQAVPHFNPDFRFVNIDL
jgi:hypothetical protein